MKIVQVLPALTKGGAEKVVVDLANAYSAAGHEVTIVAGFAVDPALLQNAIRPEVQLLFLGADRRQAYARLPAWLMRRRRWLASRDIVHCHLTFGAVFGSLVRLLRRAGRRRFPRIVETYHAVGAPLSRRTLAFHARLAASRDGFALMAEDPFWTRFVLRHPRIESAVIPNGIAALPEGPGEAEREAYRAATGIPQGALVVGTVGRVVPARRPDEFLRLFEEIARRTDRDVHFLLAGQGSEIEDVREKAAALGLGGRVHLPGLVMRPILPFSIIDLYVTLNVGPITGIAALEAAAFGLPIVAIQVLEDRRRSDEDWIWSSRDPAELAGECVRLLDSAAERRALASRQQAHVRARHSVEAMAAAYEALYRRVLR